MNFDILNLLSQFLNNNAKAPTDVNNTYNSNYPEVFFTNKQGSINQNSSPSFGLNSLVNNLNIGEIANLLPMLLNKSSNNNISKILENISPQLSKITSLFNKKEKQSSNNNEESKQSIIDLSDYTEIS